MEFAGAQVKKHNQQALFNFDVDLRRFAEKIQVDIGTVVKRVVLELHNKITIRTPVDTGRARASWAISVGQPGHYVAPPRQGLSGRSQLQAEVSKQQTLMKQLPVKSVPGAKFWIYNNLPYIKALEYGHSKQAPAGMVRVAMAEVAAMMLSIRGSR